MSQNNNPLGFGKIIPPEESMIANKNHASQANHASEQKQSVLASLMKNKSSMFEPRPPKYKYKDLILPDRVFHELDILQSMIENHDLVYREWGMGEIDPYTQLAFNFYGPSGTGKTMIVEALCERWGMPFIDINLAYLESKYVGETGKNIVEAFNAAREKKALLFFDEADAVLGRRLSEVTQSADSSVNTARAVMLKELERHSGIVAFATNFAHNYDTAFVRRIAIHLNVPLPDEGCRLRLWQTKTPAGVPGRADIDFPALAKDSDGFSGGDIVVAVKNALFDAARTSEKKVSTALFQHAIENVRSAKDNVGNWGGSKAIIQERELLPEEPKQEGAL